MTRPPPPPVHDASTATLVRATDAPRPLGALVRVIGARAAPASFRLTSGVCVLGTAPSCDVVVSEPTISRTHVQLGLVAEGVSVQDLGSRNGTFYLGQRVQNMTLRLGGRIRIGATDVAIDADPADLGDNAVYEGEEYRGMVGRSLAMRRLFATLLRLEGSLASVLVEGESGVGKELVACALHEGSTAQKGPLVVVNCGAIARDLVASELFGHKRGAFTGAVGARRGAFESADGGTLFLDEIGELPLDIQPMLLRVLETGDVRQVGGDESRHVRVRVITATHRDLVAETEAGRFREDLFYRLAVVRLRVPPLRERPDDIEPLALRFAASVQLEDLPARVLLELGTRIWPGNARELRNAVHAYAALGTLPQPSGTKGGTLDPALTELVDASRPYAQQKDALCERFTRIYLHVLMHHAGGNQTVAARLAGLDRTYLGRLLAKHGWSR